MATTKKYDVAVKVGEYEVNGEKKNRYKNIGTIMEGDNGPFLLLDASVLGMSLNYIANRERKDALLCSLFEPREAGAKPAAPKPPADDDIPF